MSIDIKTFVNSFNKENKNHQIRPYEIERYLMYIKDRYRNTKTLFYRTAPVRLMDIFIMPNLCSHISGSDRIISPYQMSDLTSISNKGLVVGNGGSGKSTLLKYLLLKVLEDGKQIPIYFELRNIIARRDLNLLDNLFEEIKKSGCLISKETYIYGLETGRFILFLDAIDEANNSSNLISELNSLSNFEPLTIYITSRPMDVNRDVLSKYKIFNILPFNQEQIVSFLNKIYYSDEHFYLEIKDEIINYINNNATQLNNPLLIGIVASTFDSFNYVDIIEQSNSLVETMINTLWTRHDYTKGGYKRETSFSKDILLSVCTTIGINAVLRGIYVFDKESIVAWLQKHRYVYKDTEEIIFDLVNIGILTRHFVEGKEGFSFVHRMFRVYFASKYIIDCSDDMYKKIVELLIQNKNQSELLDNIYDTDKSRFALKVVYPAAVSLEALIDNETERYQQCFNLFIKYVDILLESQTHSNIYYIKFKVEWNQDYSDLLDTLLYFANKKLISKESLKVHEIDKRVYNIMVENQSNSVYNNTEIIRLDKKGFSNATIQHYLRSTIDVGQLILFISNLKFEFDEIDKNKKLILKELFDEI